MVAPGRGGVQAQDFLAFGSGSKCGRKKEDKKRKRVNKNKKKNWSRHSDVKDVEEFLDDVRLQERTTGGLLSEKEDTSLFFVDTGNEVKDYRVNKKKKPLRIDLILQPDSKVPAPKDISSHQVPNGQKLKRKKESQDKLEKRGIFSRKERLLQARLRNKNEKCKAEANNNPGRGFYNLWADNNPLDAPLEGKDSWYLQQTRKGMVKRPDRLNAKPSPLPAVEVSGSGTSYNPTFESHQALLLRAHEEELKKVKEEERVDRQLSLPTAAEAPTEESRMRELCEGIVEESEDEAAEEKETAAGEHVAIVASQRERKTEKQRKKDKEAKIQNARLQAEKVFKQRTQELFKLRSIRVAVKQRQEELERRKQRRLETSKAQALLPRRLGRLKYQEPDTDVQLSEEIPGSLRRLKPEGSIAKDRFKSFQKRNLIEPRERAKFKRRLKVKYLEKRAFREITL
ncbi:ribosome biogenesis protein NOP53 [Bombina bombina]|uniref:ribosome biogenesis protein NOP53 n=1 Tax=Bombina bombina TaxID=8345 RepID=UPI00235A5477|nr:ribosome biogenesis protein NOP53 [Bombina bombina]